MLVRESLLCRCHRADRSNSPRLSSLMEKSQTGPGVIVAALRNEVSFAVDRSEPSDPVPSTNLKLCGTCQSISMYSSRYFCSMITMGCRHHDVEKGRLLKKIGGKS